ncbi:hypothetical protein SPBR_09172 [Sporothrix brasiliensis 5110]|uniref:Protein kinase domain-containing protein n=1 Tax=Sporothrix brasiliensis 5110 TaxID=1398154 RepID=A0A0C2J9R2_9PEZI|nr:uncharacterized protein SPBR_09172 [Sporothrix brasiliensis 5110]KIH93627.1 hypothetical protein SPBR_09172 [Sporothrix brasiliensis 5110]
MPQITRGVRCPAGGKRLMHGGTGTVYTFCDKPGVVAKLPYEDDDHKALFETEKRIFRRLGTAHPHIVPCLGIEDDDRGGRIYLKHAAHSAIRLYFRSGGRASMAERVRWAADLASAVHYMHEKGVRQGDIGGRNVLLDADRTILLCDFAGSGIDGAPPVVWAEGGFRHPADRDPNTRTGTMPCELHALGSTIYELITSHGPHGTHDDDGAGMAARLLRQGEYPDVSNVALGDIIEKCWKTEFSSAQEVVDCIREKSWFNAIFQ